MNCLWDLNKIYISKRGENMTKYLAFEQGIKFPWQKPAKLWYGLWLLVPIIGWFALGGYWIKIIKALVAGKNKELPEFGKFWDNFVDGVVLFVKILPLVIVVSLLEHIPLIGEILQFAVSILFVPYLLINTVITGKFEESFNIKKAWNIVIVKKFADYLIVLVKTIGYVIVYGILSIVLVGIPCLMFGEYYYFCDFYAKNKK